MSATIADIRNRLMLDDMDAAMEPEGSWVVCSDYVALRRTNAGTLVTYQSEEVAHAAAKIIGYGQPSSVFLAQSVERHREMLAQQMRWLDAVEARITREAREPV